MPAHSYIAEIEESLQRQPKSAILLSALFLNFLIGYADYVTDTSISLNLFYLLPLLSVVWFIGKRAGIIMSFVCVATIGISNYDPNKGNLDLLVTLWNLSLIEGFFIVITLFSLQVRHDVEERKKLVLDLQRAITEQRKTEKEIRESEEEKEKLIIELRESFSEIKTLSGLLPICTSCKKIRDDNGYWNQIEAYVSKHSDAQFSHAVCPDCAKQIIL